MSKRLAMTPVVLPQFHPFVGMDLALLTRRAAAEHGDRPFLTWEPFDGPSQHWTYSEAFATVLQLTGGLMDRGVSAGDAVMLHLENSPESAFCWLACGMLGAIAVPTNSRCAGPELAYFAEKSSAVGVITQPELAQLVAENLPSIGWCAVIAPGEGATVFGSDRALPDLSVDPARPLCIQFSSGTTALPKAIVWTHANALWGAMVNARHFGLVPADKTLVHSPMSHTAGLAFQMLSAIWVGASFVIQPKFSARRFWDVVVRNGCTWTLAADFIELAMRDLPVPADHKLRFVLTFRHVAPSDHMWGLPTFAAHSMTETISHTVYCGPHGPVDSGAMGRPAPEYAVAVIAEDGTLAPSGVAGELVVKGVRGLSLFSEYLGDRAATDAAFRTDGYFRTGDVVVVRDDGAIVFVDRLNDILRVGAENVAASQIEAVGRLVPGCKEIAIVGQPHDFLGEVPYAFVIPHADADAEADLPERMMAAFERALAPFKVPRGIRIVQDFPRSMGGAKIVKAELRRILRTEGQ